MSLFDHVDKYQSNCNELEYGYEEPAGLDGNEKDICQHRQPQTDSLRKPVSRRVSLPSMNSNSNANLDISTSEESFGQSSTRQLSLGRRLSSHSFAARAHAVGLRRFFGSSKPSRSHLEKNVANISNSSESDAQVLAKYFAMNQRREQHLRRLASRKVLIQRELNRRMIQMQNSEIWGQRGIPQNIEFCQNPAQRRNIPSDTGMDNTFNRSNRLTFNDDAFLPHENESRLLSSSLVSPEANRYFGIDSPLTHVNITNPEDCMSRIDEHIRDIENLPSESKQRLDENIDPINFGSNNGVDGNIQNIQRMRQDNLASFFPLETTIDILVTDSELINREHKGMVPESIFVAVAQMKPCGLTVDDRIGKYKSREIGFTGLCCKHCGGQPGFGRYFPGSFNSFLSGKNSESMVDHILKECTMAPSQLHFVLDHLEKLDKRKKSRPPHGSRKKFFFHIWTQLRAIDNNKNTKSIVNIEDAEDEQSLSDLSPIPLDKAVYMPVTSTNINFDIITPCKLPTLRDNEPRSKPGCLPIMGADNY